MMANDRRRPKGRLTTCQSPTILAAMAKHAIASQQKDSIEMTTLLSDECMQYLQSIDAADKFSNAPNAIDQNAWNHLCRMRRTKIEMEFKVSSKKKTREKQNHFACAFISIFKVRHAGAILTDAEMALTTHSKVVGLKRSLLTRCENKLLELKEQKVLELFFAPQLLLKIGEKTKENMEFCLFFFRRFVYMNVKIK